MAARSVTCAFTFESLRSFSRLACAASVFKSGQTLDTKAMRFPSGNHFRAAAPVAIFVTRSASPPSGAMRYTCGSASSLRLAVNAIHLPSGDQRGSLSLSPAVSRRGRLMAAVPFAARSPSAMPVGNSHNSVLDSLVSIANDVTGAHATRPSGDNVGSPMRLICQSAATSSGARVRVRPVRRAGMRMALS